MEIVSREDWGAAPPRSTREIDTPTAELWLHHTAGALDAGGNGVWWDDVRGIQRFHMAPEPAGRGWSDIAYSFVVGGGQIFEGRGAGIAGGHTKDRNTISHAICLVGNYDLMRPTDADLAAIAWLMRHGRGKGWWGDLTGDHSRAPGANTSCCGKHLRDRIPDLRRMAAAPATPTPPEEDDMPAFELWRDKRDNKLWRVAADGCAKVHVPNKTVSAIDHLRQGSNVEKVADQPAEQAWLDSVPVSHAS